MAAFGYMAGFAGSAVAIDVWCHQQTNKADVAYGELKPYPNEEALISFTKKRLALAGKISQAGDKCRTNGRRNRNWVSQGDGYGSSWTMRYGCV